MAAPEEMIAAMGGADLAAEHAEPGDGGVAAQRLLADPNVTVVAVRSDGRATVRQGLPQGVDPAALTAPIAVGDVALVVLDMASDTEVIAAFGHFQDPRASVIGLPDARRILGALGFGLWRVRYRCCPRDGSRLIPRADGRAMTCEHRGHEQFPRLEPAVIMALLDADDRLLLGRQPSWPERRYSVLAGFVDPGESLEDAVVREIAEEVGIEATDVTYVASQPWPFPASLMLGFTARATATEVVLDEEIAEATWFSRDDLRAAMDAHEAFIPPDVSIAHRLIMGWLGETPIRTWYDQGVPIPPVDPGG